MNVASVGFIALLALVAGCIDDSAPRGAGETPGEEPPAIGPRLGTQAVSFSQPKLIDSLRAGGEPVIAITDKGTILVAAHPGYTHFHPVPGPELLVPTQAQSYMWRSTDGGQTWKHISLLPVDGLPNSGPRGLGQGVSDPEFTVDGRGRIWFTDLEALASASVSWSDDDGQTWLLGNNVGSQGPIDRQWLASHGNTLYFTGNYLVAGRPVYTTTDGLMYERRGSLPNGCGGDLVAHPTTGVLYAGCGDGIAVSSDGASNWQTAKMPLAWRGAIESEPAVDAAGTVFLPGFVGKGVGLAWTKDDGKTWANLSLVPFFPELANGTVTWPWASAGSADRVALSFFGTPNGRSTQDTAAEWFVYTALVVNATTASPEVYPVKLTPTPHHRGAICVGTACQLTTAFNAASDRRMGDFFESTIDRDGFLHVVYSNTQEKPEDTVSHPAYVRMADGPRLVVGDLPKGFPTQG